jgi:hypothetical protein
LSRVALDAEADTARCRIDVDSDIVLTEMNLPGTRYVAAPAGDNAAVAERERLVIQEKVALDRAVAKLRVFGPGLPYPH